MSIVYLAWKSPSLRKWYTIGRLRREAARYQFVYTRGAEHAVAEGGFEPLASFPKLDRVYESADFFPFFANRIPAPGRGDFDSFAEWLTMPRDVRDPIALLARSGGRRVTDSLELFQPPQPGASLVVHFFVHGLQHMAPASIERANTLQQGDRLFLVHDVQNPHDPNALLLRTNDDHRKGDIYVVGFCPRYLADDFLEVVRRSQEQAAVRVLRMNPPPAPEWFRILCSFSAPWPAGYEAFSGDQYQPLQTTGIDLHTSIGRASSAWSLSRSADGRPL
jgi:hypothetical protein